MLRFAYAAHSVPKPCNKLIHLANKINKFPVFNKVTLLFIICNKLFYNLKHFFYNSKLVVFII